MFYSWILLTWRRFKRDKVNALINTFGLTLGITVFFVIFIYVHHEFSYDKFHLDQERIFRLLQSSVPNDKNYKGINTKAVFPGALADVLKSEVTGIDFVSRVTKKGTLVVETSGKTHYEDQFFASDHDIFEILTFDLMSGSKASALNAPMTVALSETTAIKYFGTTNAVGKSLEFTSQQNLGTYVVDAVFKDFPTNSSFSFNVIIRFEDYVKATQPFDLKEWNNWNYNYFIKTGKNVNGTTVEESILSYFKTHHPLLHKSGDRYFLEPIVKMYLNPRVNFGLYPQGDINRLYLLSAIAILVLCIAIVNYVNLTTARSFLSAKEVGIRKVTGATRFEIIFQFLGDAWIVSIIALCFAFATLNLIWPMFMDNIGKPITISVLTEGVGLVLILLFPFVIGALAGLYPAFYLTSFNPVKVLKGSFSRSQEGSLSRDILIVFQFMISSGLFIAVIVINSQLKFIETKNPGFSREHIITVRMDDEGVREKRDVFQNELLKNPEIVSASLSSSLPHSVGSIVSRKLKTIDNEFDVSFYTILSDHNFLSLYNIELIDGSDFSSDDKHNRNAYIINEAAAKSYGWDNPVGMEFIGDGDTIQITGLIKDMHFLSYRDPIKPLIIGYSLERTYFMSVRIKGENLSSALNHIESCYRKLATSKTPYKYNLFDDQFEKNYKNDYQLSKLVFVFSLIALLIAAMGLYGISMHSINLHLKEIGMRKVLGAEVYQIVLLFSRKIVILVLTAFVLVILPAHFVMREWLNSFVYHVSVDHTPFLLTLIIILTISILTISVNIVKAANANPVNVLKNE